MIRSYCKGVLLLLFIVLKVFIYDKKKRQSGWIGLNKPLGNVDGSFSAILSTYYR